MRLWLLCRGMNWAHLPVAGGIYAQHPKLLDEWAVIFEEQANFDRAKEAREEANRRNMLNQPPKIR